MRQKPSCPAWSTRLPLVRRSIARAGKPVARLVPLDAPNARPKRVLGRMAGRLKIPADFDAPLPEDELAAFEAS